MAWRVVFGVEGWLAMSWLPEGGQVWLAAEVKKWVNEKRSCLLSKKGGDLPGEGHGNRHPTLLRDAGLRVALVNDVTGAVFAAAALGGYPQFKLDVVESLAFAGVQRNFFV